MPGMPSSPSSSDCYSRNDYFISVRNNTNRYLLNVHAMCTACYSAQLNLFCLFCLFITPFFISCCISSLHLVYFSVLPPLLFWMTPTLFFLAHAYRRRQKKTLTSHLALARLAKLFLSGSLSLHPKPKSRWLSSHFRSNGVRHYCKNGKLIAREKIKSVFVSRDVINNVFYYPL